MSETRAHVLSVDIPSGWHVELGDQYHTGLSVVCCLLSYTTYLWSLYVSQIPLNLVLISA